MEQKIFSKKQHEELVFMAERLAELENKVTFRHPVTGKAHEPQLAIKRAIFGPNAKSKHFWRKGRKGGGTEALLYPAARICGTQKNKLAILIYPDSPSIDRILGSTQRIRQYFPPEWQVDIRWTEKARVVYFPLSNSSIEFWGAHNWESMQGFEADMFGFDEIADGDPRAYTTCAPNARPRNALWVVCGAPPLSRHNYYHRIEKEALMSPNEWAHFKWNFHENPFLPEFDWEAEERGYILRGEHDVWKVQWLAEYVYGSSKSVLKAFRATQHIERTETILARLESVKRKRYFVLYDPGYAVCFAVLLVVIDCDTGSLYVIREVYEKDRNKISARQIWDRVQQHQRDLGLQNAPWTHLYDSAGTGFSSELRDIAGDIPIIPAFKQAGDEEKYFRSINDLCVREKFLITGECENCIFEMENYITDDNGRYPDAHNHTLDLLRYISKHCEADLAKKPLYDSVNGQPTPTGGDDFMRAMLAKQSSQQDWPMFRGVK